MKKILKDPDSLPFFSIIVPTYNSSKTIKACIDSIFALNYPKNNFELVVSDDGSNGAERELLIELSKNYPFKLIFQKNSGAATARNSGVRSISSKAKYVLFIDSDSTVDSELLLEHVAVRETYGADVIVSGKIDYFGKETTVSRAIEELTIFPTQDGEYDDLNWAVTNNISFSKKTISKIKLDEFFKMNAEDVELCYRLRKKHKKIIYTQFGVVHHVRHNNLMVSLRRAFKYGWGTSDLIRKYPSICIISPQFFSRFLLWWGYFLLILFAILTNQFSLILLPVLHVFFLLFNRTVWLYSHKKLYSIGLKKLFQYSFIEMLLSVSYGLGVSYKNMKNNNGLLSDVKPGFLSSSTSTGIFLATIISQLNAICFSLLLYWGFFHA